MTNVIIPFYILVDVSHSMRASGNVRLTETAISELVNALQVGEHGDQMRFSIIQFADTAELVLPLTDLATAVEIPGTSPGGQSNFSSALSMVRLQITSDLERLQEDGLSTSRPILALFSDGGACDDWRNEHRNLTEYDPGSDLGFPWFPRILPVGVGRDVDEEVLQELAYPPFRSRSVLVADEVDLPVMVDQAIGLVSLSRLPGWVPPRSSLIALNTDDFA